MTRGTRLLDSMIAGEAPRAPVHETLRLGTIDAWGTGWVRKTWTSTPEVLFADGAMFGGYTAALADQVLAYATFTVLPDDMTYRTINLQVQFLGPTRDQPLLIEGRVVSQTQKIITVECDFRRQGDQGLVAIANAQQIVMPLARG